MSTYVLDVELLSAGLRVRNAVGQAVTADDCFDTFKAMISAARTAKDQHQLLFSIACMLASLCHGRPDGPAEIMAAALMALELPEMAGLDPAQEAVS